MRKKILICVNSTWNVANFRKDLVQGLVREGFEVIVLAPVDDSQKDVERLGCRVKHIPIDNGKRNPIKDIRLFFNYCKVLRQEKPFCILAYTAKPNIYSGLAARVLDVPAINNIAGLGSVFINPSWTTSLMKVLYRISLKKSRCVFFQNSDDSELFLRDNLVSPLQVNHVPGSGVDLDYFNPEAVAARPDLHHCGITFIMVSRMLWDKGVSEFISAAKAVKHLKPDARFLVAGIIDSTNPSSIPRDVVARWQAEGIIYFFENTKDVRPLLKVADCLVLPSYREGLSKSLLEGAAMELPIITTNVPGCRELVREGKTGFLCDPQSADQLASAMMRLYSLGPMQREQMGRDNRENVRNYYSDKIVTKLYLEQLRQI